MRNEYIMLTNLQEQVLIKFQEFLKKVITIFHNFSCIAKKPNMSISKCSYVMLSTLGEQL